MDWLQGTTIPTNENKLSQLEIDTLTEASELCMNQSQFQFRYKFYKLKDGTCMGNQLSCFVANVFMCFFENELGNLLPHVWLRYVDDVFAKTKMSERMTF